MEENNLFLFVFLSSEQVSECAYCEASVMWHQLSTKLVQYMAPENPIRPPDVSGTMFQMMKNN